MFESIISLIERYSTIIIHRHSKPDGDALGSQVGLKHIILENYPDKRVLTVGDAAGRYAFIKDSTPDEVADAIMAAFERWQIDKSYRALLITPERLRYPDIPSDPDLMSEYSSRLDMGESVPEVLVTEDEGDFYLVEGLESALAYSFNMNTFIPATLVKAEHTGEYIQMKNSL